MISRLADLLFLILVCSVLALAGGPFWIRLARRLGLVDLPGAAPHKTHRIPTPLAGGLLISFSLAIGFFVFPPELRRPLTGMLGAGLLLVAFGIVDDRWGMPPLPKLAVQSLSAVILVMAGIQVHVSQIPVVDLVLTLFWVVGLTNAFNFVDSMDGLALGLAAVAASFFMLVTIDSAQPELAALSAAILGAVAGTMYHNITPARLFLGDSGSQLLGFLLAALGIAYTPGQAGLPQELTWFVPILVLGVPIFDMTLVVSSRIRRRQPIYHAGLDHTYHRMVALGVDPSRAVVGMHLGAMLLAVGAFVLMDAPVWLANTAFFVAVLFGLFGIVSLERRFGSGRAEPR